MTRSVTLALSSITNRIWTPLLFVTLDPLRDSVFGGNAEHYLWAVAGLGAWLGWTVPLFVVHRWLNHQPALSESSVSQVGSPERV